MHETIVDKVRRLLNVKERKEVTISKNINGKEWYLGLINGKYIMTKELERAVTFQQSKSDLGSWLDWVNRRFAKGWKIKTIEK